MAESASRVRAILESDPDQRPHQAEDASGGRQVDLAGYPEATTPDALGAAEVVDLAPRPAPLNAEPSAGIALLCVQRGEGPGEFTMTWSDGLASHQLLNKAPSGGGTTIADIMHAAREAAEHTDAADAGALLGGPWQRAYQRLIFHWKGLKELGSWVEEFTASATAAPQLVIWDVTGQDMPWELYHHGTEDDWLGVTLPVSRWAGKMPEHRTLGADSPHAVGPILLFDDGQTHEDPDDPHYLDVYRSITAEQAGEPETSMVKLLARLELENDDFGLLVIRGHGSYARDLETFTVAGLPLLNLAKPLKSLKRNSPAVLLNVCHSGRTWVDETAPNLPVMGFVEPLIEHGASIVIAVMAQIDTTHLHDVVLRLVGAARQGPVTVAEWLREHRAYYLRALKEDNDIDKEELHRMFLTSSLYVCYCQPGTTLHVTAARPEPAPAPDGLPSREGAR